MDEKHKNRLFHDKTLLLSGLSLAIMGKLC